MKDIGFLKDNLIIHKGVYNYSLVENTIIAFEKCVHKNYIIELDVHILNDKSIVIYHDYNLFRLCKVNKIIESLSYAQLSKVKIKNKYSIPTLLKVMNIVSNKVPLLIDIKDLDNNTIFETELVKILDEYKGKFAVQSINPFVVDWFLKNKPNYTIGIIIVDKLSYKVFKKLINKVDFISVNKNILPIKIKNKLVIGWTIDNYEDYLIYNKYCDNLICEKFL